MTKTSKKLYLLSIFSAYFYIFMEWLFLATKESALSKQPALEQGLTLIVSGGVLAFSVIVIQLVLQGLGTISQHLHGAKIFLFLAQTVPALIISATSLILVDNFTYTVFKFGIISTSGVWRGAYALGLLIFFVFAFRFVQKHVPARKKGKKARGNFPVWFAMGLFGFSLLATGYTVIIKNVSYGSILENFSSTGIKRPNILILGADGLSVSHLSVYGFNRNTTPFLSELSRTSLVGENHFTNASSTTASTTSVLTGKDPVTVDVMRYPDLLKGNDAYQHLPGILKQYGYTTEEVGVSYWVDAIKVNLLDGFDVVNGQPTNPPSLAALRRLLGNSHTPYFIWEISNRLSERVLHIFYVRQMPDPMEVVKTDKKSFTDQQRYDEIINTLENAHTPVFIFAHFMDTHGPDFSPRAQVFSHGASEESPWSADFYDDAIKGFDSYVQQIVAYLDESGQLDNTIIVIYTDHGYKYATASRIPLLMHFPNDEYAGPVRNNTQNIDIPATLLDYMGVSKPDWMSGLSLLDGEPPADREIITIIAGSPKNVVAPFYQIKTMQFAICNKWYQLNVQKNEWQHGTVIGHTSPCETEQLPDPAIIRHQIIQYLKKLNFDVSSLYQ